jgi:hypothetical protein
MFGKGTATVQLSAIDDGDDRGIGRDRACVGIDPCRATVRHENDLAVPGSDEVDGNVRRARDAIAGGIRRIDVADEE